MDEKKGRGGNRAVIAVVIVLLAMNFLQLRSMRRELQELKMSINKDQSNLFGSVNEVRNQIGNGINDIKEELQKSQSMFTSMSSTVKLQDGKLAVTMRAVPKEVSGQEKLIARLTAGQQVYEEEMGADNQAVLSIDPVDVVKPEYVLKSDTGTRQEPDKTLYMEEFLYCETSCRWDAGQSVMNLQITPSESVILTEDDVEKAEFIVVSTGITREFETGSMSGGSHYAASAGGRYVAPGGGEYIPEPVKLPQGDTVEARLWNGGAEDTISFRGDFSEYIDRKDGIVYEIYFILTTKSGIRFATPDGRSVAEFCYAENGSSRGENGGRLKFIAAR